MSVNQLKNLRREWDHLKITTRDLGESGDPLSNILRNVMTNDFYARNKKGEPESP
jgi:hypothetical protein